MSSRTQGLIWYGIVEREPAEDTAALLGMTREDVTYGTDAALQQLTRACLRTRLTASEDPDSPDFGRLIEEAVRPDSPRDSADLHTHMTHCPHCTTAYEELAALRDAPSTALAEGLLPWGGRAYVAGDPGERAVGGAGAWRSGRPCRIRAGTGGRGTGAGSPAHRAGAGAAGGGPAAGGGVPGGAGRIAVP
ncbi:hypothetical protein ACPCK3_16935 [Streptomyces griseoincarnatus]